jgi:hydrogenase maturation factor
MCLAIPGKIVKKNGKKVTVDYGTEKREAAIVDGRYKVGDFVIVQGKIVVDKVPAAQVRKWHKFLAESSKNSPKK